MKFTVKVVKTEKKIGSIVVDTDSQQQADELVQAMITDEEIEPKRIKWKSTEVVEMKVG